MDCIVHGVSKSQTQLSNFHLTLHHMVAKVLQLQLQQSVLPMNIQGWFSLGSTGLTSLQSKGLSRVFSNTMIWKHQFFGNQSSLQSNSHIRTWLWKTIALTRRNFVQKDKQIWFQSFFVFFFEIILVEIEVVMWNLTISKVTWKVTWFNISVLQSWTGTFNNV